jgi:hypothetical protein
MNRVSRVARILLTAWAPTLGWPLAVLTAAFTINLAVFWSIGDAVDEPTTGGLASIFVVQFIACWQLIHQFFGFVVGLNATRRSFYAAALLVTLGQSLAFAVLLYGMARIEDATGGWGINLAFFDPVPVTHSASPLTILVYAVPMALMSCWGLFLGSVTKRWGTNGFFVLSLLGIVAIGLVAVLITWLDGWSAIGTWLLNQSPMAMAIGWALLPAVALAAAGYAPLRTTVP